MKNNLHVIVGMGLTGFSIARFLQAQHIPFALLDTREVPPQLDLIKKTFPNVPMHFGSLNETILDQAAMIVLSPSIAITTPIIQKYQANGIPIIGDIELFAQHVAAPVIAITGTNAKSTVTTLVGNMAEAAGYKVKVGGNLGIPALDLLLEDAQADLYVLELSSFQLETTYSLKPKVATILNITPDHLDRYASFADYILAKQRIYQHAKTAVCNRDDVLTDAPIANKLFFTLNTPAENQFGLRTSQGENYLAYGNQILLPIKDLTIKGKHYQANALAALAIGFAAGMPWEPLLATLKVFKGLPHRCEFIADKSGVKWYDDSKGTNVGATLAAIEGIGSEILGKIVLIAGGVGKNQDFSTLVPVLEKYCRHIVLIGEAGPLLSQLVTNKVPYSFATDMRDAVIKAGQSAQNHDCVLLSPACASFDMFQNFSHRGEVFQDMVKQEIMHVT